jgi:hypothetical protein
MPDITAHNAPKSDQLDNIDLRDTGPRVFTITQVDVKDPDSDQPVIVHLAEFERPWKPGKNMRRALAHCWSTETDNWVGKRVELYADVKVKFGNDTPGGTRLSRASHIDKTVHAPILLGQGKPGTWKVEPLPDEAPASPPEPTAEEVAACSDQAALRGLWERATSDERREQIKQRKADLDNEPQP